MPPTMIEIRDALALPAAIAAYWGVVELLISGIERRDSRRMGTRERLVVCYLWPLFLTVGAVSLFLQSRRR